MVRYVTAGCEIVEEVTPEVVSFHFGLPDEAAARACQVYRMSHYCLGDHGPRGAVAGRARV